MDALSTTTHATCCYFAFHSQSESAPLVRPAPIPLVERARWSVSGALQRFRFVAQR